MTLRHSRTRRPRHSSLPSLIGMRQSLVTSRWCPSQTVRWPSSVTVSTATDGCIKRSTPSHSTPRRNRGSLALKARLSFCSSTQLGGTSTKNCPHDLARLFVDYRRVFRVERSFSVDSLAAGWSPPRHVHVICYITVRSAYSHVYSRYADFCGLPASEKRLEVRARNADCVKTDRSFDRTFFPSLGH